MRHGAMILAAALAGCTAAADVPENIPARGVWRKDATITRVAVNGLTLNRDQLPVNLPADEHEELGCVEPALRTLADFQRIVAERTQDQCRLDALSAAGATIAGSGSCTFRTQEKMAGVFTLTGSERPDAVTTHQIADVFAHAPGGSVEQVRVVATVSWRRLGDC